MSYHSLCFIVASLIASQQFFGGKSVVWIVDVFSLAVQCNLVLLIILLVMTELIVSTQECLGALSLH